MPSFFSVRVAPGIRLSASTRGLRAHVGPRAARLHVGGGRTGVSTGAGPVTFYTSGGASGRRASYASGPSMAQVARADKAEQARMIADRLDGIHRLHRQAFDPIEPSRAGRPPLPDFKELLAVEEKSALARTGIFQRGERRSARAAARKTAEEQARQLLATARQQQSEAQARLDDTWRALLDNDEDAVVTVLDKAFEDNEAPVAAVGVQADDVSIVVLVPDESSLPDREPNVTAAGNLSLRKASRSALAEWYRQLVAGHVLLSVRETLANAPGAQSVTAVAVRRGGSDLEPLLAVSLDRSSMQSAPFESEDAWSILHVEGRDLRVRTRGVARSLQPLDLRDEPEIAALVAAFDAD